MRRLFRCAASTMLPVLFIGTLLIAPASLEKIEAQTTGGEFQVGKSYSLVLAGFSDRTVQVVAVAGNWIRVKQGSNEYWLNSNWVLEAREKP